MNNSNKKTRRGRSKTGRIILYAVLAAMLMCGLGVYFASQLPDKYYVFENDTDDLKNVLTQDGFSPVTSTVSVSDKGIEIDFRLLGIVPLKSSEVEVVAEQSLMAGGQPFGIKFYTDGVLVVSMTDVETENGKINPAYNSGIRVKDVLTTVNGTKIKSNEHLTELVKNCGGEEITVGVKRDKLIFEVKVTPEKDPSGTYRLGCWVRDSTAGIGTVTFYDMVNKTFAGLGHGICDSDTGELMTLSYGKAFGAEIFSVIKGIAGTPGELRGSFDESVKLGTLYKNCEVGVFGEIEGKFTPDGDIYPIAFKQDVREGEAEILCTTDESGVQSYSIEIVHIYTNSVKTTKNMVISITDEALLEKTGGIVQGMSGSPIIQDGKIIGAVTHVMINDPTKGYGIFIENMLNSAK